MVENIAEDLAESAAPLARIRALLPSLPPSDRRAAEVISARGAEVLGSSISEIAQAARVAESTVIRACKRLGFTGFQDLKLAIARDVRPQLELVADEIRDGDSATEIVAKVFAASSDVLSEAVTSVDTPTLSLVVDAMAVADRVLFVGLGPSSPIAQDAAYRFRSIGVRADAPIDSLTQHQAAAMLHSGDVCVLISHTGATRETLEIAATATDRGAVTVAVTSYGRSPLTRAVEYPLIAGGRQLGFRVEAMASRLAHLCVLDSMYVALAMRDSDRAMAALDAHHAVASHHQL
ncbi:MurR/RpiR family transcriptional regulator [Microbacterium sp. X-17]|uniref:MurR/RpiR family transcriptional regulator n=1 Tax=Microbacterium sp. X-17 TaxID=3144404 RepID=UPI0031F597CD